MHAHMNTHACTHEYACMHACVCAYTQDYTYPSNTESSWGPTIAHAIRNTLYIDTNYHI